MTKSSRGFEENRNLLHKRSASAESAQHMLLRSFAEIMKISQFSADESVCSLKATVTSTLLQVRNLSCASLQGLILSKRSEHSLFVSFCGIP